MQIEIIEQFVDRKLVDVGIKSDFEEQAVRLLLFHLCIAIDIYRHMTQAEKNKSGYWYREELKNSFSLTGFLKERKRKRDKKKSPLHPSYKEESGVKEKANTVYIYADSGDSGVCEDLESRRNAFFRECMSYKDKYDEQMIMDFYAYYSAPNKLSKKMRFEDFDYWDTAKLMHLWVNNPISKAKATADIKLKRAKGKKSAPQAENTAEQRQLAAEREAANARREQELAESKAGAVSYEEYLRQKESKKD